MITSTRTGDVALTVAVRGRPVISEISPRKSPWRTELIHFPPMRTSAVALDDREELTAGLALACELGSFLQVELVRDRRDFAELTLRAVLEQGDLADQRDLGVLAQLHPG